MKKERHLIADALLIAGLLLLALLIYLLLQINQREGSVVSVCVNGAEIARYSLAQDGEYPLNGGTNLLVIEDGAARIAAADCPDALCIHQGKIRYSGQCITCLPNRLTVTVLGGEGEVELIA